MTRGGAIHRLGSVSANPRGGRRMLTAPPHRFAPPSGSRTWNMPSGSAHMGPRLHGPPSPIASAKNGKSISRIVAGAGLGAAALGIMKNRNGRATDKMGRGRPTGMYGY